MVKGYLYIEIDKSQSAKHLGEICGDVIEFDRNKFSTTVILCDGLGSGIKANIAANMCAARMKQLLRSGFSLRKAFTNIASTMTEAVKDDLPFSAFSVMRILSDGTTSILTYEMPPPLFLSNRCSVILPQRNAPLKNGLISESNCVLKAGDSVLIMSDGITQAGLGKGLPLGWTIEGANKYVNECLANGILPKDIPEHVRHKAKEIWKEKPEDDCTVIAATSRPGRVMNIFTGPPKDEKSDPAIVKKFINSEGLKIVCGASTAKIVARELNKELNINDNFSSFISPPDYSIDGIDLVTEGAVTLNQVYNIWDEDPQRFEKNNPAADLYALLTVVDKVNFIIGTSQNPANADITFRQMGILDRKKILELLTRKLEESGKLVVTEYV